MNVLQGIHVLNGPHPKAKNRSGLAKAAIPTECSEFQFFFRPILPSLAGYWWTNIQLHWRGEPDPNLTALLEILDRTDYVPPGTILPEFARYVFEGGWAEFYGFRGKPALPPYHREEVVYPASQIVETRTVKWFRGEDWIDSRIEIHFGNVDGAFWFMYARDQELLRKVEQHVALIEGAHTRPADELQIRTAESQNTLDDRVTA